jgi:diacylglycerol O-acyltransferase / wax synthase
MANAQAGREMSAFDAFLFRGDDDPRTRAVLAAVYVLDRVPSRERFIASFDRASRVIVRLRQRVVSPPWPVFLPSWIIDPDFDLDCHLRFATLPARASLRHLLDAVQAEVVTPLDTRRPLWEAVLYQGLAGGRAGLLFKMSHAVTDGIGAVQLFRALFDTEREPEPAPLPPPPIPEDVTPDELLQSSLARSPWALVSAAGAIARTSTGVAARLVAAPEQSVAAARDYLQSLGRVFAAPAPPSPALAGRSLARRLLALEVPLEALKRAGKAAGGSLNDAYLAGASGGLRLYHEQLGQPVDSLPMAIPVNLRRDDDPAAGNFFGVVLLAAPLDIADPRARIAAIGERMREGRAEAAIGAPALLAPVLARLPDRVRSMLAENAPTPDVQVSNIPASPVPLHLAGSLIERAYAFGPVPGVGAMLTLQSIAGTCYIGVNLDPAAFTQPETFAKCLAAGFEEVLALGGGPARLARPVLGRAAARGSRA